MCKGQGIRSGICHVCSVHGAWSSVPPYDQNLIWSLVSVLPVHWTPFCTSYRKYEGSSLRNMEEYSLHRVSHGTKLAKMTTKWPQNCSKMTSVAKEKSEICHISFTFPITVANENFNLARALSTCQSNSNSKWNTHKKTKLKQERIVMQWNTTSRRTQLIKSRNHSFVRQHNSPCCF
jgi:hypothetical protein